MFQGVQLLVWKTRIQNSGSYRSLNFNEVLCRWGLAYAECVSNKGVFDSEVPDLQLLVVWSTPSMTLLPGPFWTGVVVRVMDQIDLFKD